MTFSTQTSPRFSHFEPVGIDSLATLSGQIASHCDKHWEDTLRPWLEARENGMPPNETLRNHGTWLIPHSSHHRGLAHKLFRWRGVIVFEGWFETATGQHLIRPHTESTPLPWKRPAEHVSPWVSYLENSPSCPNPSPPSPPNTPSNAPSSPGPR